MKMSSAQYNGGENQSAYRNNEINGESMKQRRRIISVKGAAKISQNTGEISESGGENHRRRRNRRWRKIASLGGGKRPKASAWRRKRRGVS